ncbi:BAHD acyltransferase DCR [Morella rubra]|uniref:BAHD acyltransferase DCR n=1 Tax=Morella rubra TaxID=262757 RepID=A0A6A1WBL5_9ROSI|nr:BAHD acyltransferase DCR [Morella rubra]
MDPPLPQDYFGNCGQMVAGVTTAGELLQKSLGWTAWQLHQAVVNHTDKVVLDWLHSWLQSPYVHQLARVFDRCSVVMTSSPRFNMYGSEFGIGRAVALRSGYANKFDGKVTSYPGYEGGGSVDLEVSLSSDSMSALESNEEFMEAVSVSNQLH